MRTLNPYPELTACDRKGTSFLSRLAIRGTFKKDDELGDSDSEHGESRTDGSSARALTSVVGAGGGYIPLHKEPPRYIRVRAHNKKDRSFNHLFLAQELLGTSRSTDSQHGRTPATVVGNKILKGGDAIWAAEFSVDGKYLAVAGKDQIVRVFAVISTPEERKAHEQEEEEDAEEQSQRGGKSEKLSAPVFRTKPIREFTGHTGEVLALSWSKNNFLLSSSMDKTVKLWHLSRQESICTFKHDDLVTSIAFHPTDDRFFLAGSLDAQLRLWSIPDKMVAFSAPTTEFITAVAFSPDGKTAICGLLSGLCLFYETDGLKNPFQIHVRSSRGKNAKGSKITGIRTIVPAGAEPDDVKVLISSNDSRVRIYNLKTRMLEVKFKGHENQSSQIHARFSDDGQFITSGSEDRRAYMWNTNSLEADMKDKQPYECFDAHPEVVTTALIAPTASKQLLSASGDPIYDLCNPPPVTLLSLNEASVSQSALSDGEMTDVASMVRKPAVESPQYIERSKHKTGNIIVTTDRMGVIKVFRQDCAYVKRQQQHSWETGSKFSGKVTSGIGRSGSIVTRTSGGSRVNSRRGSLNLGASPAQAQSDRINSWRHDVEGTRSRTPTRSERSISPMKSNRSPLNLSASNIASEARKQPYASNTYIPKSSTTSMLANRPVLPTIRSSRANAKDSARDRAPTAPPTPSFSMVSGVSSDDAEEKEGSFWNLARWRGISGLRNVTNANAAPGPGHTRGSSDAQTALDKAAARKSMGANDFRKMIVDEAQTQDRRRSMGVDELVVGKRRDGKKRTDSGVGQLSDDSEDEDE